MDYRAKVRWLSPKRVMKLYNGQKAEYGSRRLFVIGIGSNGIDILVKCKDIAENRYGTDKTKIRFWGIGLKETLDSAKVSGSVLDDDERLEIDPDEAIYPYLNEPAKLPPEVAEWFDEGLRNYTPNKPVYGLTKRQCARLALFHYFDKIKDCFGEAVKAFAKEKSTIEVVFTGNLGDAFFGGMVIDLAYIARAFFALNKCPVTVTASMLAADTALLQGLDGRDLAIFYANTIVTKCELDKFQYQKKEYVQKFSPAYTFSSNKAPFSSCFINAVEENYKLTVENAALKIMTDSALVFKQDDDADRLLAHNMLGNATQHSFRYLTSATAVDEIPMGKIVSYLTLKTLIVLNNKLMSNTTDSAQLKLISSKVIPDEMLLALKAGELPKIEYDETLNPLFSVKSLKNGAQSSKKYVNDKLEEIAALCKKGADEYIEKVFSDVADMCEKACCDISMGPYCAAEIAKRCLSTLKKAIEKKKEQIENADMDVPRDEHQLMVEWRSIHGAFGLFGTKDTEAYISRMKRYAEGRRVQLTGKVVLEFYEALYNRIDEYYRDKLDAVIKLFGGVVEFFNGIVKEMRPPESGFVRDAFDISQDQARARLDRLVEQLPKSTLDMALERSKLLSAALSDDPKMFASEACTIAGICFRALFASDYDELCQAFGTDKSVARALENCIEQVTMVTPTTDEQPLVRMVCPQSAQLEDVAGLRAAHNNLNSVWTNSSLFHTVIVQQVRGGVKLDEFKDYQQWENMRYAYVNDSLKKHGIHIFI